MKALEKYRKTKKGILTNSYSHQKSRHSVSYSLKELHDRFLSDKKFDRLFKEWIKSGYSKQYKPSIDRINCKIGYTLRNVHCLTWAENRFKQIMERRCRKGPILQKMGNVIIKRYKSQREAVLKTGLTQSNISMCLTGKRKTSGGYNWEYENPELLKND